MTPKSCRFRRFIAIFIDWNLSFLPCLLVCAFLVPLVMEGKLPVPLLIPFILSGPVLFLFRELLGKGRSLGNRLMKLVVLNRRTLQPLSASAMKTRNILFLFFGGPELLFLLTTGATLGDRAVAALVVHQDEIPTQPLQRQPTNGKTIFTAVLSVILAAALVVTLLLGIVFLALDTVKDEPHYQLAYRYLLGSETFAQLDAEESHIRLTGYSSNTTITNGEKNTMVRFTFLVKGHQLVVVCHPDGEDWYICEECTIFR